MTYSPLRFQASPAWLPARAWQAAARIAARAAVVTLAAHHHSAFFVAAGVLAAGTAIAAQAEARFRARHGKSSDLTDVLAAALCLAAVLVYLLAFAAGSRAR